MRVVFRLYAKLREQLGTSRVELDLEDGATVMDALGELFHGDVPKGLMVAVNNRLVEDLDTKLRERDVVDVMPPASGG